jgi:hypothetical protein
VVVVALKEQYWGPRQIQNVEEEVVAAAALKEH